MSSCVQYSAEPCLVTQLCPIICDPMDCSPPSSSVHGDPPARTLEWVAMPFSRGSSQPRDRTQVCRQILYHLSHRDLSLLQGILSTQESNWGLLYCRRILYQLSYQGAGGNTTHILVPVCLNSQSRLFLTHALIQQVFTENLLCVKGLFLELGR